MPILLYRRITSQPLVYLFLSSSSYILRALFTRVSIDMAVFWGAGVAVVSINVEVSIDWTGDARMLSTRLLTHLIYFVWAWNNQSFLLILKNRDLHPQGYVPCTWKRLMGWISRLQNFPTMLYISVTVLKRRIHIFQKSFMCYFVWVMLCFLKLHILSNYYVIFTIEFLLSRFSSLFVQWFFPQPRMNNLAAIFQRFPLLFTFFTVLLIFPYPKGIVAFFLLYAFTI